MTDNTKPEALDLADWLEAVGGGPSAKRCAALLREQHARIAELESELEAVGAGGVQALSAAPAEQQAAPKAVPGEPPGIQALMCVISSLHSLRDTAHFSDEEGELTNDLCTLRDWAYAQTAAFQPAPTAQAAESVPAPVPPPKCETEAEKRAFAFGWFKALESERMKAESVLEDAMRYRWLCCKFGETRFPCALENWLEHGYIADGKPSIDAAIDAAIKQGEKQ